MSDLITPAEDIANKLKALTAKAVANGWVDIIEDRKFFKVFEETSNQEEALYRSELATLEEIVDRDLITSQGTHSIEFYSLEKFGIASKTFEEDSFGPLVVGIADAKELVWLIYG